MGKRVITFAFHPGVPRERQDERLAEIARWKQLDQVSRLKPDAQLDSLFRLCYAYLSDEADPNQVMTALTAIPEIESASLPPARRLV